ncbi:DUF362 domain-containing protein [Pseudodesulfovibrio portus]|uniref:DUF362 domain-containing protein n=1 Tax=Pseudodesulfovibrio portus TaxID=231439 RepID=A0ABN6RUT6_9BACT|nr:DUF362 domain-containing protein [Pseudodesulfovibrio portus]BDQ33307.1 hypothetical protein JCM14722_08490 [Pseudodesulfovibrio portus]
MPETVAIARVPEYDSPLLDTATAQVLENSGLAVRPGDRVLVKPNLVNSSNARHCTTHPQVVRAACAWLLDRGAAVTVADSPAFGPASRVARASDLARELAGLGIGVKSLKRAAPLELTGGGTIGLSQDALEADRILNMPKLKVHCQMTMSGAVKNLFGCVVGFRKAVAHYSLGHSHEVFRSMLMDVYAALPRTHHLLDGVHPLHRDGPINGHPFALGMLAASANGVALDTAAYTAVGLTPERVPLWGEAVQRQLPGSDPGRIAYPMEQPHNFDATGFILSAERELAFRPLRLIRGRVRSLLEHFEK